MCFEVVSCGPDVIELAEGMHVLHISAAGDKIPGSDMEIVREEDVILNWYPPDVDVPQPNP